VRRYLRAQVEAGADALQLFDSWVGHLTVADYRTFIKPHVSAILQDVMQTGVPVIHFGTGTSHLLADMREAGGHVIGIDTTTSLKAGWQRVGHDRAVQGNLDPTLLFAPPELAQERAKAVLGEAEGRAGHIFNLGHGILPETPVENVQRVIDFVHGYRCTA
jgi:uroporphyrinogen decarboxylase